MRKVNRNGWLILSVLLLGLIINITILYFKGERGDLYDVKGYVEGADHLIESGSFEDFHHVFYALHVAIIALGRLVMPDQIVQVIVFQILLSLLSVVALFQSSFKLFKNSAAAFLSCLIFLIWWDCIHWNTTLMSESLFCSLTIILIYLLIHFDEKKKDFIIIGIVLLCLCFTRPTSIVILVGVAAFFTVHYYEFLQQQSQHRKYLLLSSFLLLSIVGATLMFQKWDFTPDYIKGEVVTYMSTIPESPLYYESLHTPLKNANQIQLKGDIGILRIAQFIVNHPGYFLTMAFKKVYYLLSFQRPYYSMSHNLYSAFWLILVYSSFIVGFWKCHARSMKAFTLCVIVVNCMLIAMSAVDWDNRFFIPMEPGIVLFAGYGFYSIVVKWIWNNTL